ncbi:MAG: PTS glucose transporter subunit IIA [Collinsella sp.]|nr:PTS glucose transporter subunit IIA [Collinsella sp.]
MFSKLLKSFGLRARGMVLPSPLAGDVIPLSEVNDGTFAAGLLGEGVALHPTGGRVIAPADGKVEAIFPTGHAVALHTDDGFDVLIHVGLETCKLEGRHFKVHASAGDRVGMGDLLIEFDREAIEAEGYDLTVPVLIRNAAEFASIKGSVGEHVAELDQLIIAKGR